MSTYLRASPKVKENYFWGARQDELIAAGDEYALTDHLGTVRKIIDASGKTVSELEYDALGKLISSTGTKPRFRYTAKMFDDDTDLQWNINRWYDPDVGRWISEDPIGFLATDMNLVRYLMNLPVSCLDPFGLVDSSNLIISYSEILEGKTIVLKSPTDVILQECVINLRIPGNDTSSNLGAAFRSDLHVGAIRLVPTRRSGGKCYCTIDFYIAGAAFAVVYPTDTDNARDYWRGRMQIPLHAEAVKKLNIAPPFSNNDVNMFQKAVTKHENNHIHPFAIIKEDMLKELKNLESKEFECDLENNTYKDPGNIIRDTINKLNKVWADAKDHSNSIDDDENKRVPSYFDFPLEPIFKPTW